MDASQTERPIVRIGVRLSSILRSRTWLLGWLFFYLWVAFFLGLWHLAPARPNATLRAGEKLHFQEFSPDGKTLVTAGGEPGDWDCPGPIRFWDVPSGRERVVVVEDWGRIDCCQFSPDGKLFAAMNEGHHLKLWESATGKEVADLPLQTEAGQRITWRFSPNGAFIIYEPYGISRKLEHQSFQFWEIKTQQVRARIEARYGSMTIAADGKTFIVTHIELGENVHQYTIERWRFVDDPRVVVLMKTLTVSASHVPDTSPNLDRIVTVTRIPGSLKGEEIRLWDCNTGEEIGSVIQNEDDVYWEFIQFGQDGRLLLGARSRRTPGEWQFRYMLWNGNANLTEVVTCPHDPLASEDGRWILRWIPCGALVLDTVSGGMHGELRNASDEVYSGPRSYIGNGYMPPDTKGFFSPDSKTVVITGLGRNRQAGPMTTFLSNFGMPPAPSFQYDHVTRLWDVEQCQELACFEDCDHVLYSPDSKILATAHKDGTIRLWDVPPRKPILAILCVSVVLWVALLVGVQLCKRLVRRA